MNDMAKNLILWVVIAIVLLSVFNNFSSQSSSRTIPYSQFVEYVESGQVDKVVIDGSNVSGRTTTNERFETVLPAITDIDLMPMLLQNDVAIEGRAPEKQSLWAQLLVACFPILLIVAIFMFFMRQMQGGGSGRGGPMTFGKSRARLLSEDQIKTTFADVAGCDEAKDEVQELVAFLRDPGKFQRLGGKIPRGVLMVGPPGTGKTLLAKAPAKPRCRFSPFPAPISWKCSWAWVRPGCGICLSRPKNRPPVSCLSTRLTPWDVPVGPAWAAATTSGSRP